jgi:hypothetical protein
MNNIKSKKSKILTLVALVACNICFSQDCNVVKVDYRTYILHNGFIDTLYKSIQSDTSSSTHIVLFTLYEQVNKIEGTHLTTNVNETVVEKFDGNSTVSKKQFSKDESLRDQLTKISMLSGYFLADCKYPTEHHQSYFLLIENNKRKILIDVFSSTAELETFFKMKEYASLAEIYALAKEYGDK